MSEILKHCQSYLDSLHNGFAYAHKCVELENIETGKLVKEVYFIVAYDLFSGLSKRAVAVEKLGSNSDVVAINQVMPQIFDDLHGNMTVTMELPKGAPYSNLTNQDLPLPNVTIMFTDELAAPIEDVRLYFETFGNKVQVVEGKRIMDSVFISYGGTDEEVARSLNTSLKIKGVKTWFFPDDSIPGQKLHRMMFEGVNTHDKVILICSESSLHRNGVLNEIERVLEREASLGGAEILIPIALDDFVYTDWAPERKDIAAQVRSRVITKLNAEDDQIYHAAIERIANALSKA